MLNQLLVCARDFNIWSFFSPEEWSIVGGRSLTLNFVFADIDKGGWVDEVGLEVVDHSCWCRGCWLARGSAEWWGAFNLPVARAPSRSPLIYYPNFEPLIFYRKKLFLKITLSIAYISAVALSNSIGDFIFLLVAEEIHQVFGRDVACMVKIEQITPVIYLFIYCSYSLEPVGYGR